MKPGRKFYQKTKEQIICGHLEIMARNHKNSTKEPSSA